MFAVAARRYRDGSPSLRTRVETRHGNAGRTSARRDTDDRIDRTNSAAVVSGYRDRAGIGARHLDRAAVAEFRAPAIGRSRISADHLLTVRLSLPRGRYRTASRVVQFTEQLRPKLLAIPGVTQVPQSTSFR